MSQPAAKISTLGRNNQEWESLREEIYQIYMKKNNYLSVTRSKIEEKFQFKRRFVVFPYPLMLLMRYGSERKRKSKLKEWGYTKNTKR